MARLVWYHVLNGSMIVPAGCENSSVRYRSASSPFACAVAMIEYNAALHIAPFAVLLNSQFLRPTANGRIAFSARLLSIGTSPSSRNVYRYGFSCSTYCTASANLLFPLTGSDSSHAKSSSSKGLIFARRSLYRSSAVRSFSRPSSW